MKEVTELTTDDVKCDCPHCGETQYGFCGDPRGGTFECDDCGESYQIHNDADVDFK